MVNTADIVIHNSEGQLDRIESKLDEVLDFIEELRKVTEALSSNPMMGMMFK